MNAKYCADNKNIKIIPNGIKKKHETKIKSELFQGRICHKQYLGKATKSRRSLHQRKVESVIIELFFNDGEVYNSNQNLTKIRVLVLINEKDWLRDSVTSFCI